MEIPRDISQPNTYITNIHRVEQSSIQTPEQEAEDRSRKRRTGAQAQVTTHTPLPTRAHPNVITTHRLFKLDQENKSRANYFPSPTPTPHPYPPHLPRITSHTTTHHHTHTPSHCTTFAHHHTPSHSSSSINK